MKRMSIVSIITILCAVSATFSATGTLQGTVTLERPGVTPPDDSCVVDLTVTLCTEAELTYDVTTDSNGYFSMEVESGLFDVLVKGGHTLAHRTDGVLIPDAGSTDNIDFGLLPEGDADGDNFVLAADFFILKNTYNLSEGQPGFDPRADFNQDGAVTTTDFFFIKDHYNVQGDVCPPVPTATPTSPPTPVATDTPKPTNTPEITPTATPTMIVDDILGNMIFISANWPNSFQQGAEPGLHCHYSNETPFFHILTRDILVMRTEITRQMWHDLQVARPELPPDPSATSVSPTMEHPVQNVTWYEAVLFANILSQANGLTPCYYRDAEFTVPVDTTNYMNNDHFCNFDANGYRLPFEGEWEYFCRAGTGGELSCYYEVLDDCGSCDPDKYPSIDSHCVYCANSSIAQPVGSKLPNPWNLLDVHGNVQEWVWDKYGIYPSGTITDYTGPVSGNCRIIRGGAFSCQPAHIRSARRLDTFLPGNRYVDVGFRLVRTVSTVKTSR